MAPAFLVATINLSSLDSELFGCFKHMTTQNDLVAAFSSCSLETITTTQAEHGISKELDASEWRGMTINSEASISAH